MSALRLCVCVTNIPLLGRRAAGYRRVYRDGAEPLTAEVARHDFETHFWWAVHIEMLTGRIPALADRVAEWGLGVR